MVKGADQLRARFKRVPELIRRELVAQLEKEAAKLVSEMNALKPLREIEVNWTWGEAPKGSIKVGTVRNKDYGKVAITIYSTGPDFAAAWFEFGTAPRFQKSGKPAGRIIASPYFWPVYRANKKRIRSSLTRAVNRGMKKA